MPVVELTEPFKPSTLFDRRVLLVNSSSEVYFDLGLQRFVNYVSILPNLMFTIETDYYVKLNIYKD